MNHVMSRSRAARLFVGAAVMGSATLLAAPAGAANNSLFYGDAAGVRVQPQDLSQAAQLTAESGVFGGPSPQQDSNSAAATNVSGVVTAGSTATSTSIARVTGGWKVEATSTTKAISILGGTIKAAAVTTTAILREIGGKLTVQITNAFSGLHIVGVNVPPSIPTNWAVKLGSLAIVGVNSKVHSISSGTAVGIGAGLTVRLLEPAGSEDTGASIIVNPVEVMIGPSGGNLTGHSNGGSAYGTKVVSSTGSLLGVDSDPTAPITVNTYGTSGQTLTSTIASVHIGTEMNVGAVTDTGYGLNTTATANTDTSSTVAAINLFSGLIKAKSIATHATASADGTSSATAQLTNLVVAGVVIDLNVSPNTTINVTRLGHVIINQQISTAHGILVRGLDIVLTVRRDGLPVGTELQIATASAAAT